MTSARIWLIFTLWLGVPCLFFGQGTSPDKKPQAAQMQEDIEIMRRILNRAVDLPRYAQQAVPTGNANNVITTWGQNPYNLVPNVEPVHHWDTWNNTGINQPQLIWPNTGMATVSTLRYPAAEGVYLKGHGVVLTLTLPPQKNLKPNETATAEKSLTEWERVRKEIRGEKPDGGDKKPKDPTIADILIKVLAENGKHFTQLGPDETVTIVVTFRQAEGGGTFVDPIYLNLGIPQDTMLRPNELILYQHPLGALQAAKLRPNQLDLYQFPVAQPVNTDPTQDTKVAGGAAAPSGEVATKGPSGKAKDSLLLGDLHYKQGKIAEAIDAYMVALKELQDSKEADAYAETCFKLAQCFLAENKAEEAKHYVELVIKHKKPVEPAPTKKEAPTSHSPTKLIISAPKKVLDQVGSGKMSIEEFKKEVTVEYSGLGGSEKKE
jgi:tetratricopeptide (TPR) repeat protein